MALTLALLASVCYGTADFLGGLASRRTSTVAVVALNQAVGLLVVLALIPLLPGAAPGRADLLWGAAAGVAGGLGVGLLYQALAVGTMSVVAPVTAVCAIAVPVAAGLLLGERPGGMALLGVGLTAAAIVLVGQEVPPEGVEAAAGGRRALVLALAAGAVIGLFYLAMERTSAASGLWPLVIARSVSVALTLSFGLATKQEIRPARGSVGLIVAGGAIDMAANVLYLLAVRQGMLSIVATLASLYPATTVLLAGIVLRERLRGVQIAGLACAVVAIVLITG